MVQDFYLKMDLLNSQFDVVTISLVLWMFPDVWYRLLQMEQYSKAIVQSWLAFPIGRILRKLANLMYKFHLRYVLVHPDYQGHGIAGHLLEMVKDAYKSYLYINVMIGDSKNATFYEKHGFKVKENALADAVSECA